MRVLLIAAVLLVALPVVAQDKPNPGCTHADVLDALRRARKWLPANEEAGRLIETGAINLWREPQTAAARLRKQANDLERVDAARLREQADDLERVDAVLRACK